MRLYAGAQPWPRLRQPRFPKPSQRFDGAGEREERGVSIQSENAAQLEPISVDILDACRLTGVGRSKMYELMDAGAVRSVKVGRRRLIPVASLREWLAGLEAASAADPAA